MTDYGPLPETRVIGFGHRAQTGKDVAARALASMVSGTKVYGFSDAITAVCRVSHGMTFRDPSLLQRVGLEARAVNPEVWLEAVYWRIEEDRPPLALITGVRFENEVAMIRAMGGEVWRIDRFNDDGSPFCATDRPPGHPTETALEGFPFDKVLPNRTGSMDAFVASIKKAYWAVPGLIGKSATVHFGA